MVGPRVFCNAEFGKNTHYYFDFYCCQAQIQRGDRGPPPIPEKAQKYRVSSQYCSGSRIKTQSYQASIQCLAIIGPPGKRQSVPRRSSVHLIIKENKIRKDQIVNPYWANIDCANMKLKVQTFNL